MPLGVRASEVLGLYFREIFYPSLKTAWFLGASDVSLFCNFAPALLL